MNNSPLQGAFKYDKLIIHSHLWAVRVTSSGNILGYVTYSPDETGWIWVHKDFGSVMVFQTANEAVDDLVTNYTAKQMDQMAAKMGVYNNEDFTKGR